MRPRELFRQGMAPVRNWSIVGLEMEPYSAEGGYEMDAVAAHEQASALGRGGLDAIVEALPTALLCASIGLFLSIVLVTILHRKKVYTRRPPLWNALTKLS